MTPAASRCLRQVDLDPAEVHSIANQHDFAGNTDVHVVELLEVLGTPVIDIDHIGGEVTGRGRAVKAGSTRGSSWYGSFSTCSRVGPVMTTLPSALVA